eukprot:TRINITY_DN12658_c0_g1_i1.p1 TRINITY_DN12658_c0_g1~~TRINITY_DN12658_c0_g1_i1.p1  ORF type:complete len:350 (+),score=63.14 TRINITY_DN12658_c0_g1_i1:195-1244(+)
MAEKDTIFVAIPSYRDSECQWTVKDLFEKAKFPDRVFVGICWQYDEEEDKECFKIQTRPDQVRIHRMDWKEARGPCLARSLAQKLFRDEEYYLQIDSHMRFVPSWDEKLIQLLQRCPSSKPIITTYPVGYELPNVLPTDNRPTFLVVREFGKEGMLRLDGKQLTQTHKDPLPSYFWVSGFAFSRSEVIREVPYDPHLPFLFFGEETQMNVRLWTHGWDFFSPGENIIFHLWTRSYRSTFRQVEIPNKKELEAESLRRVQRLLQMLPDEDMKEPLPQDGYGLGNARSLEDYKKFSGIDLKNHTIEDRAKHGGLPTSYFLQSIFDLIGSYLNKSDSDGKQSIDAKIQGLLS